MRTLVVDIQRCTGCHQCELACSFAKHQHFSIPDARLNVIQWEDRCLSVPVVCLQCEDAPCLNVCPTKAISQNAETGAKEVDADACIGCQMCVMVCPTGSIRIDRYDGKAVKCDLCGGDPECVKVCAPDALIYEEVSRSTQRRRWDAAERIRAAIQESAAPIPLGLKKLGGGD